MMNQRANKIVPPLRLGIVPYLNVQPMVYGLADLYPQLNLSFAPPSELERMLQREEIDLGIIPVFAAFMREGRAIYPAPVIASNGPVYSVLIVGNQPIEKLKRIRRDSSSLTSNALAKVLLREYWQVGAQLFDADSMAGDLGDEDGQVVIGDPAIREHDRWPHVYDLGGAWKEWTGLPFVFAAWIGPQGQDIGGLDEALSEMVRLHGAPAEASLELRARYLRENLTFAFGPAERKAIELFHAACARQDLIEDRPLIWADHNTQRACP
jgi:chorismate dehydratase